MVLSAKMVALVALTLLLAPAARAQSANPDRCEGTLCDLYYGAKGEPPKATAATPAGPTPMTTATLPAGATALVTPSSGGVLGFLKPTPSSVPPSAPAEASNSYMHLGGGGVLGGGNEPCSGTLCDVLHGSPLGSAEDHRQQASASAGSAMAAPVEAPVPHRHIVHESETRPKCSSPTADPWRCYR